MSGFNHCRMFQKATASLCIVLMLNLSLMSSGCGLSPAVSLPVTHGGVIALTPDHPISIALRGTAFEGATALEVEPSSGTFRLVFPDAGRTLTGRMVARDGALEMAELNFASDGLAATMKLDPATRQVVAIETSYGHYWEPTKDERIAARPRSADELQTYLAANESLLAVTSPDAAKTDSSLVILIPIAAFIMLIWAFCADGFLILCPGFPILFGVIIAILNATPPPGSVGQPIPLNNPPVAQNDAFTTPENTVLNGNVLNDNGSGADSDPDGDLLTTTILGGATNGTVNLQANGSFSYTPNTDFEGNDTFTYTLSDGRGGTDTATATITVTRVNQPPDARDDFFPSFFPGTGPTTLLRGQGGGLNILMGNVFDDNGSGPDSDPDGDTFMVVAVEGSAANVGVPTMLATGGVVTLMADGSFEFFTEDTDFEDETFTYTIADPGGLTDTATVTIDIID